ncbi:unnamed protein product [Symbiodinium pilosum]|uniref:Uncharacterized protein n=1 Tax=Symbiodinium pilosum TaxID=2952 RepID=A0A812SNH7_SYMPI|nr:unnamed protein product [Symbiodinium pilosum]
MPPSASARDCDAASDVSSWVCVPNSGFSVFVAGTMLKAKVGQAFEYLQAKDLRKGAQIVASDDQTLLEVLDGPEVQSSDEIVELWTGDRLLRVDRQQQFLVATDEEAAATSQASPAEKLHPGDWIKVNGRFTRLVGVDIRAPAEKVPAVRLDLSPSLPAATFSLALSEKDPFVATV